MSVSTRIAQRSAIGLIWTAVLLGTTPASAYCRTTTCDPNARCSDDPANCCLTNSEGCDENGIPISWPSSCVSFNIHKDGSELRNISAEELSAVVDEAYEKWLSVDCDGDSASLSVDNRGLASCGDPEYNQGPKDRNANVWMFRDSGGIGGTEPVEGAPVDARTLAITTLSIDVDSGAIYGVDVELNSALAMFTTSDTDVQIDLASIVTHEAGHFLGLDHSREDAVMTPEYRPGDITPRELKDDDIAGLCSIYPVDRNISGNSCEPQGKYSPECNDQKGCGCHIVGEPGSPAPTGLLLSLAALGAVILRRTKKGPGSHSAGAALGRGA